MPCFWFYMKGFLHWGLLGSSAIIHSFVPCPALVASAQRLSLCTTWCRVVRLACGSRITSIISFNLSTRACIECSPRHLHNTDVGWHFPGLAGQVSKQYSARDMASHTKMKFRQSGQGTQEEVSPLSHDGRVARRFCVYT
jgi:hypothetical protein